MTSVVKKQNQIDIQLFEQRLFADMRRKLIAFLILNTLYGGESWYEKDN